MIEVQRGKDYISFYDLERRGYVGIIFFTVNEGRRMFCVSCAPPYGSYHNIEEIFNVVQEPLLTPLLFDIKVVDEIFENLDEVDWI